MAGKSPKNAGFPPKARRAMATADAIRGSAETIVREAVAALGAGSRKAGIARAARLLGWRERRVRAYLDREVRRPLADEVAALLARADAVLAAKQALADAELSALADGLRALRDGGA